MHSHAEMQGQFMDSQGEYSAWALVLRIYGYCVASLDHHELFLEEVHERVLLADSLPEVVAMVP